ncbi:MAG: hypothetical protein EBX92_07735 [Actinobacteria bacterium]|nr:hypothetical protein [Actinomycetota bacterium]
MTNFPQPPNFDAARGAQGAGPRGPEAPQRGGEGAGLGQDPLADPGVRMLLSISPQDGSVRPLPSDLNVQPLDNGTLRVNYPDGSVRELIPGAEDEGRMITTLPDGTRIQSDLTFGEGQVSISSITSNGEKSFLSLNENGANIQRISPDGNITNEIPESAAELIQGFREAEAFSQAEEIRNQDQFQFQGNQEFGEWNNFGKPMDWQPDQGWQPPQQFGEWNNFGQPQYAGNNWIDAGNGSWIAPVQPDAYMPPQGNWQPPQYFDGGFNQGYVQPGAAYGLDPQPEPPHTMSGGNWQPPQQFGEWNNFAKPEYAGNNWVDAGNGSWIAPIQPDAFMPPHTMSGGNWQPPQNFGPQFGAAQGIIDTNGFPPPAFTDAAGFPFAGQAQEWRGGSEVFDNSSVAGDFGSADTFNADTYENPDHQPLQ